MLLVKKYAPKCCLEKRMHQIVVSKKICTKMFLGSDDANFD